MPPPATMIRFGREDPVPRGAGSAAWSATVARTAPPANLSASRRESSGFAALGSWFFIVADGRGAGCKINRTRLVGAIRHLCQDRLHHFTSNVGETKISAIMKV